MQTERRSAIKKLLASVTAIAGFGLDAKARAITGNEKQVGSITTDQTLPLFSTHTIHNGLVYIAGVGAQVEPFEIKAHTEIVLIGFENELIKAGSSMEKVLKVSVFLNDIADYDGMNEVYRGRFGKNPPVRTTVAVAKGGVPGNSLVEIDCIAYL